MHGHLGNKREDVRQLEALKPNNVPSMGERYDAAVAKERRLEAAAQPAMKQASADAAGRDRKNDKRKKDVEEEAGSDKEKEAEKPKKQPRKKKQKKAAVVNEADLRNVEALKEE